jgi:hypothetical protein
MAYKYSMYKVHTGDITDDTNYYGERPDPKDNYYKVKEVGKDVYALEMIDGLSEFPNEDVYRARLLTNMKILKPQHKRTCFFYDFSNANQVEEFNNFLRENTDFYWLGYKKINNHDTMFKFDDLKDGYSTSTDYYKKTNGLWTWAEELSYSKEFVKPYVKATELIKGKTYYYYDEDKEKFIEAKPTSGDNKTYYEIGAPKEKTVVESWATGREPKGKYIYSEYGPRGNVSYYTWDTEIIYYRKDCDYHKQTDDKTNRY